MKFKKGCYLAGGGVLALALALTACGSGGGGSGTSSSGTITVAVAGPMTGDNGIYGQNQLLGVQFAAQQINQSGGIPSGPLKGKKITVVKYDDQADPNQGASIAQNICDNASVMAVFGHSNSSVLLAAEPIYERCGVPVYDSYASNPTITAVLHKNLFRNIIDDSKVGTEMASFAKNTLGFKRVGVIASPDDYGTGLKTNFTATASQIGLDAAKVITTSPNQKDFTPQLTELRDAGADSLVLLNTYTDAALQVKQARALGWNVPVFTTSASNNPAFAQIAGAKAAEGVVMTALFDPGSTAPGTAKFVKEYAGAHGGTAPTEAASMSYDSFFIFLAAVEKGATDRASLITKTAEIGTFDLPIQGELTFNAHHEPTINPSHPFEVLLQVHDGKIGSYKG